MNALLPPPTSVVPPVASLASTPTETPAETGVVPYRFTVEDYLKLGEVGILSPESRVELIDGLVLCKPMQNPRHIDVLGNLVLLTSPLSSTSWIMRSQAQIKLDGSSPEPDLVFFRGPKSRYSTRHAIASDIGMIVEVADSSVSFDSTVKLKIYARNQLPVYWLVNIPKATIEVYTQPANEGFGVRTNYSGGELIPVVLDGVTVSEFAVADIFA